MALKKTTDQQTLELMQTVKRQKEEISKAERPNWRTNCSFSYNEGRMNEAVNLHTVSNVKDLIMMAAFIQEKETSYIRAAGALGVESAPAFTWQGFTALDWLEDLKLRVMRIQIEAKKKKLAVLESRLAAIISPELKAQMELEAIANELK